ncbi:hypothetical protein [Salmonella sp. SKLX107313]|uniref:hypothetical protein n=1 Tax=Salmonella sp. SKLX107313 TaxID=3160038 RepID=UPI003753EA20
MLNILHYLKSGMLLALFFLTFSVLVQPLVILLGYRREDMVVGVTELISGTLYVPYVSDKGSPVHAD